MPYRQEQLINDEIYHIVVRKIEDKLLFNDIDDYYRGIFSIYEFNNINPVTIQRRRQERARLKKAGRDPISTFDPRDRLVDLLSFCLMPNHIHLLIKQLKDGGATEFIRKIGIGYGGYFNRKYNRQGYVFQNRFKAVHIKDDDQLKNAFVYIHTNPVSLVEPKWKERGIENPQKVIEFLENYKWSSYPDYIDKKNFPSITEREFLLGIMGDYQDCREFVNNWIENEGFQPRAQRPNIKN